MNWVEQLQLIKRLTNHMFFVFTGGVMVIIYNASFSVAFDASDTSWREIDEASLNKLLEGRQLKKTRS